MKKIKHSLVILFAYIFLISLSSGFAQELTPEQIYEKTNDCVVVILSYDFNGKQLKQGSGVVISDKGWVVTNYHVFAECEKMEVKHNDKIIKYTDIIGVDVEKDILILKIEDNTFPAIPIGNSDNLKVGQRVYAIGSPLGLENSMSEGIVSGLRNVIERNKNYIQITASISPGSSGGAVVNKFGEIIGISTSTLKGGQNLNFAIPINEIMEVSLGSFGDKKHIEANNYFFKGYNAGESGNYSLALDYYNKCLDIVSDDEVIYNNRGIVYHYLGNFTKSIMDFSKAVEINPKLAEAYNNRGLVYCELKEYQKAILDFDKSIELKTNYIDAYFNRGIVYYIIADFINAISDFDKSIEIEPNYVEAYIYRGNISQKQNNYSNAVIEYTKALVIDPSSAGAYYNRGLAYGNLNNKNKACEDLRKAYSLGMTQAKEIIDKGCK